MPRVAQAPPPGVVRLGTPEATPNKWWDTNNVRWRGNVLQPIGGNVLLPGTTVSSLPRDMLSWHDNQYQRWCAVGTDTALYVYSFATSTLYDITPAGVGGLDPPGALIGYGMGDYGTLDYGTARDPSQIGPQDIAAEQGDLWSLATFGELLLVVPTQDGHLFTWDPNTPDVPAVLVSEAPISNRGVVVTDQRQIVLLGAGGDPRMIAWSDTENMHVWAPDVTNLAGSLRLVTQAYVMCAVKVSQGILIFTSNDLHLMQYTGPPYAYGIVQVASACGPISQRAPVAIGSFVCWPSVQNFWAWSGNAQPIPCDIADWFFSLVNRTMVGRIFASPNPPFGELWFDFPDEGSLECNRYVAINYSNPAKPWMIGQRSRTAADPTGTMDYPLLGGPVNGGGGLYLHEYGWTDNGTPRAANGLIYAESGCIEMGEGDKRYHCKQLVFDTAPGNAPIGYRFLVAEQPTDVEWDTGLYTNIHGGLMDMRWSGRTARMRLEALADGPWAIGRPRLELRPGGRR